MELVLSLGFFYLYIVSLIYPWTNPKKMRILADEVKTYKTSSDAKHKVLLKEINILKNQLSVLHDFLEKAGLKLPSNLTISKENKIPKI